MGCEENRGPLRAWELPQYLLPVPGPSPGQASRKTEGRDPGGWLGLLRGMKLGLTAGTGTETGQGALGCVSP